MSHLDTLLAALQDAQQRTTTPVHPSQDLQHYILKRGRYHLRPDFISSAIEALELGGNPDAPAALQEVVQHQITPSLKVAVYAPRKLTGAFRTAEEGEPSTRERRAGNYAPILDSRSVLAS